MYTRVNNETSDEQKAKYIEQILIFFLRNPVLDTPGRHQLYIGLIEKGAILRR
jgi:hypothetical protein